ncbi:hypothetical protein [Falsibacillus pallidus]|uniref:Uncharacterized protein n=1 Tax=Falsibacillus pallidus TaxID=493781 RepID=A0A370G342_9BACI|nr:hypothetical protein [Falsibacillus pallidus]RDI37249.1 hypothetical protein DFR59_12239 [Falsibacillus pallidus]
MYFTEMELKAFYEMKREMLEMEIAAIRFKKDLKRQRAAAAKPDCCDFKIEKVCCEF